MGGDMRASYEAMIGRQMKALAVAEKHVPRLPPSLSEIKQNVGRRRSLSFDDAQLMAVMGDKEWQLGELALIFKDNKHSIRNRLITLSDAGAILIDRRDRKTFWRVA